jgi:hypothetical protein
MSSPLGIILKNKKHIKILNSYKNMLIRMDKALEQINLNDQDDNEIKSINNKKSLTYEDENIIIVSVRSEQNNPSVTYQMDIIHEELI